MQANRWMNCLHMPLMTASLPSHLPILTCVKFTTKVYTFTVVPVFFPLSQHICWYLPTKRHIAMLPSSVPAARNLCNGLKATDDTRESSPKPTEDSVTIYVSSLRRFQSLINAYLHKIAWLLSNLDTDRPERSGTSPVAAAIIPGPAQQTCFIPRSGEPPATETFIFIMGTTLQSLRISSWASINVRVKTTRRDFFSKKSIWSMYAPSVCTSLTRPKSSM